MPSSASFSTNCRRSCPGTRMAEEPWPCPGKLNYQVCRGERHLECDQGRTAQPERHRRVLQWPWWPSRPQRRREEGRRRRHPYPVRPIGRGCLRRVAPAQGWHRSWGLHGRANQRVRRHGHRPRRNERNVRLRGRAPSVAHHQHPVGPGLTVRCPVAGSNRRSSRPSGQAGGPQRQRNRNHPFFKKQDLGMLIACIHACLTTIANH